MNYALLSDQMPPGDESFPARSAGANEPLMQDLLNLYYRDFDSVLSSLADVPPTDILSNLWY
jgi:hypothetical protein